MSYLADRREPNGDRRRRELPVHHGDRRRIERRQTSLQAYLWNAQSRCASVSGR